MKEVDSPACPKKEIETSKFSIRKKDLTIPEIVTTSLQNDQHPSQRTRTLSDENISVKENNDEGGSQDQGQPSIESDRVEYQKVGKAKGWNPKK